MSGIINIPVRLPLASGANITLITQLVDGCTVPPLAQVVAGDGAMAKSPLMDSVPSVSGVFPVLVKVTVFVVVLPSFWVEKLRLVALKLACGLITVALKATDCGLPPVLSVMTRVAVESVGLKIFTLAAKPTAITQLRPAPNVPGRAEINGSQLVMSPKSPKALPGAATLMLEMEMGVFPVLVRVTNWTPTCPRYTVPKFTLAGEIFNCDTVITFSVKLCVALGETPLLAVKVML